MNENSPYSQLRPKPLWNAAVDQIKDLIDTGKIPVGSRLPAERKLCEELGISRVSLRESLRVLQSIGYVETRAGSGTYARLPEPVDREETLAEWLQKDIHIVELFEMRRIVEPGVAELAARRSTHDDIQAMQQSINDMRQAEADADRLGAVAADAAFHRLLGESAGNSALSIVMAQMQDTSSGSERRASLGVPGQISRAADDHQEILDAITRGDAAAAALLMREHLDDAVRLMQAYSDTVHSHTQDTQHNQR